jgi:hypothetical protein
VRGRDLHFQHPMEYKSHFVDGQTHLYRIKLNLPPMPLDKNRIEPPVYAHGDGPRLLKSTPLSSVYSASATAAPRHRPIWKPSSRRACPQSDKALRCVVLAGARLHACYQKVQAAEARVAELYARRAELPPLPPVVPDPLSRGHRENGSPR